MSRTRREALASGFRSAPGPLPNPEVTMSAAGSDNPMAALAAPGVRKLRPYQPGKPIAELERELGIRAAVKLASNENPLGAGREAREAIQGALGDIARYPDGNGFHLKAALARHLEVDAACLTLGNGSNDVLELVARAFATPADEVIYSQHAFAVYPLVTQAIGAAAVVTPARSFGHDLEAMGAAVTERTRLVFIANPNNPTGTWVDATSLERFLGGLPRTVLVVVDEAYFEYLEGDPLYPSCVPWVARFPNLVVTRTFSKVHGLAGLRVGYAVSSPEVADLLNRVRQPFNVNSVALAAAEAAIADTEHVARSVEVNHHGMRQLTETFDRMGLPYIPSAGNFVSVDVGRPAGPVYEALLAEGVIVRPVEAYGMPSHLRVSVGLERENRRFLSVLHKVLERGEP